ncbi:MAG: hypothetical protein EHM54_10595 [Nitrospiraceae bacterium]|nr:MAG: hypothetical protein EHM54_10595 [Nitrospiraceae bacterium]
MICALCKKEISTDKYFSRKSTCPKCGGDLHICLNCRFFSESSHNKCLEPKAEFQRTRERANFCDFFVFRENIVSSSSENKDQGIDKIESSPKKNRKRRNAFFQYDHAEYYQ